MCVCVCVYYTKLIQIWRVVLMENFVYCSYTRLCVDEVMILCIFSSYFCFSIPFLYCSLIFTHNKNVMSRWKGEANTYI